MSGMRVYMSDPRVGVGWPNREGRGVWIMDGNAALPVDYFAIDSPPILNFPSGGFKRFTPNPDKYWTVKLIGGQLLTGKNDLVLIPVEGSLS